MLITFAAAMGIFASRGAPRYKCSLPVSPRFAVPFHGDISSRNPSWTTGGPVEPTEMIDLVFAVKQTNVALLESTLLQVSDPGHQGYGKHLSLRAVNEMVRPSVASASAISSFLRDSGIDIDDTCQSNGNGDLIKCVLSVMQVEAMLEAKYINFEHKSGVSVLRTLKYSLPASVASHVDFVAPTVHLPPVRTIPARTELSEARNNTPSALRALYGLGSVRGRAPANSQVRLRAVETGKLTRSADLLGAQAVTGFLQQHFLESDLHQVTQQHCCPPSHMLVHHEQRLHSSHTNANATTVRCVFLPVWTPSSVLGPVLARRFR